MPAIVTLAVLDSWQEGHAHPGARLVILPCCLFCFPSDECAQAQAAAHNFFRTSPPSTLCKNEELPRETMAPRSPSGLSQLGSVATVTASRAFSSEGLAQLRLCRRHPESCTQHRAPVPARHERVPTPSGEDSEPWGRPTATRRATVRSGDHGCEARQSGDRWCGGHIFSGIQSCELLDRKINRLSPERRMHSTQVET